MNLRVTILTTIFIIILSATHLPGQVAASLEPGKDERMAWWRDARFGMFIHWGLYALPAGEWKGETDYGEWIRTMAEIPLEVYDTLVQHFNPVNFNAEEWVEIARDAGMKYIVITSKHHDGFCLFDSKYTEFDIMSTPFKRDIMKELADACRKHGLKICWYHSIMDWHHPDYLPRRDWEKDRQSDSADFNRFFEYLKNQVKELLTNYGDIGVLWFDGEWESTWSHEYATKLYNYVRETDPRVIINNRIDVYRDGMGGLSKHEDALGDFGTPEQEIPETGLPGKDWESCMTMNDHWGYNKADANWKSSRDLILNLVDIASKGGNYLLNIGPTAEGEFPAQSIERLKNIGEWMRINGSSIYGTMASPFRHSGWGKCTQRQTADGTRLYLHIAEWPKNGKLTIPNLLNEPVKAFLLSDRSESPLTLIKKMTGVEMILPSSAPDPINSVIVLDIKDEPNVIENPEFTTRYDAASDKVEITMASVYNDLKISILYSLDGSVPGEKSPQYSKPFMAKLPLEFKALLHYNNRKMGDVITVSLPVSYGKKVALVNEPGEKYKAGGPASLTDGMTGSVKFTDGTWIGTEENDFVAFLDLGKKQSIRSASLGYLVVTHSWIFEPTEIIIEYSTDGEIFKPLLTKKYNPAIWKISDGVRRYSDVFPETNTRYVRFTARNRKTCPAGHPGAGGKCWVFVDEITVE